VDGYFFNPNIYPAVEYERRLVMAQAIADRLGFQLMPGVYDPEEWLKATASLAREPESGKRCEVCFRIRLNEAHRFMEENGFDCFVTTLTVSPHKSAGTINRIGREIGGDRFLARDFKKQGGYQRSLEIAKSLNLYRQHYCGCVYSQKDT